jgi:sugar phosphate isomerase/epimerase
MAGIAALGAADSVRLRAAKNQIDVGLELYSLRREIALDLPGTLAHVKAMGFREVEVPGYYGLTPEAFRSALDATGLRATSLVAQWDVLEKGIEPVTKDLATLGANWAILPWIPHKERFERTDAEGAARKMNAWGAAFAMAGCRLAYHPHGYEFQPVTEGTLFDVLAAQTDPAVVHFEMDTFWIAWPGQDCVRLLEKYPRRFRMMHLKDLRKGAGPGNLTGSAPDEDSVAIGDGTIPWTQVLTIAKQQGCEEYYIEDESPVAAKQIPRSLEFLKSLGMTA